MAIFIEIHPLKSDSYSFAGGGSFVNWWDNNPDLEHYLLKIIQRYSPDLTKCTVIRVDGKGNCLPE